MNYVIRCKCFTEVSVYAESVRFQILAFLITRLFILLRKQFGLFRGITDLPKDMKKGSLIDIHGNIPYGKMIAINITGNLVMRYRR